MVARARSRRCVELAARDHLLVEQALRGARDRVARLPARQLGRIDVGLVVGLEVAALAIGDELEEARPAVGADRRRGVARGGVDGVDVVAVDHRGRQAVARGPGGDAAAAERRRRAGSAGIVSRRAHVGLPLVVLAHEEQRQLPDDGEVDRLVEDAFAGGAVAEEARR